MNGLPPIDPQKSCDFPNRDFRCAYGRAPFGFTAGIYPMVGGLLSPVGSDTGDTMMMSLYFVLGILLLIAVRNPSAHRSLIAFAAWSSLVNAAIMAVQAVEQATERGHLFGDVPALIIVGVVLLVLAPAKQSTERA